MNYVELVIGFFLLFPIIWRVVGWLLLALRLEIYWRINDEFSYDSPRYNWVMRDFGFMMLKTWRYKYRLINPENVPETDVVLYGNHLSSFDPGIILYEFRHTTMAALAKKEIFDIPIFGKWLYNRRILPIDKANPRKDAETIIKATQYVKEGQPMLIFPEGTLSRGVKLLPFKTGAFRVALKSKRPIVVFRIEGTDKHKWYHIFRRTCTVEFFPPIPYEDYKDKNTQEIGDMVRRIILEE